MSVRNNNLVVPLADQATAMRITDTADCSPVRSGAVSPMSDRRGDVDSTNGRGTPRTAITRGTRTSVTATRTTTTTTTSCSPAPSADHHEGYTGFSFEELVCAEIDCRRTKRNTKSALAWEINRERNLCQLYEELVSGEYRPGRSVCFVVLRPKPREVWAAQYRDRIVHHLIYNRIGPRFERSFIADSCACMKGRGTLYAARRLEAKIRSQTQNWKRPGFYLKCDVSNFFVSINKDLLREELHTRIPEPWWRALVDTVLMHDPRKNALIRSSEKRMALVPSHKSLLNQPANRGLPIGNLSSQFFANVVMDELDQHSKHDLKARHYIRYVDDFLFLHESPDQLNAWLEDVTAFLPDRLQIELNPKKTILQPIPRGVDFVGHVVKPWRTTTRRRTHRNALQRLATIADEELFPVANSLLGLHRQASHSHHDRAMLANVLRDRGYCIDGKFTKTFRGVRT